MVRALSVSYLIEHEIATPTQAARFFGCAPRSLSARRRRFYEALFRDWFGAMPEMLLKLPRDPRPERRKDELDREKDLGRAGRSELAELLRRSMKVFASDGVPRRRPSWGSVREIVGIIWSDADRFVRRRLAAVLLLVIAASVLTALGPLALKWLVDGFTGQARNPLSPSILVGAYVLSQFLARAVGEVRGLVYARAERRMFRALSGRLFAHILRLPLRFHLDRKTGGISQTLENGLTGYQMILHHLVFTFLPVTAELGTIIVVLVRLAHPAFLMLFCGALACYAAVFAYAAKTIARSAKSASAAHVDAAAQMTDAILNVESVKYFAAEAVVQERVGRALSRTESEWVGFYRRYAVNGVTVSTIFATFLAATTLYAVREVEGSRLTVGDFVLVTTYMLQVIRPVEALGYAMQGFSQGAAMLEKMIALFHEKSEPRAAGRGRPP